jgi:MoaA/NifB/PqqE/SkfB family radical SAM enzyme
MISLPLVKHPASDALLSGSFAARQRSPVPDLLFEDQQIARVAEIRPYLEQPEDIDAAVPLHRVTVFLTYGCNLACVYCKTIARSDEELRERPQKRLSFTLDSFGALLDSLAGTPLRHLHFTGGEAALVRDLPDMVRLARARGVEHLSITSNGTLPADAYLELVDSGLDEVRISLDADEPALGEELTLRHSAWRQTVRTIRGLSAARRPGKDFFLIVNTVVGRRNRHRLVEIVRFLLDLGPDDIKLITDVDTRGDAGFAAPELLAGVAGLLAGSPPGAFPLLRRKVRTVFAPDAVGLETVAPHPRAWRCYIPLTERTVDAGHYYPCSVYLREGGRPLGRLDEPQTVQRARTAEFVRDGDCLNDPICRRYCLHCTRAFNADFRGPSSLPE